MGWHTIHLSSKSDEREIEKTCTLVVTPRVLTTNLELLKDPVWGVMAQLYSVRSLESWGIGDFHDLGAIAEAVAMLLNDPEDRARRGAIGRERLGGPGSVVSVVGLTLHETATIPRLGPARPYASRTGRAAAVTAATKRGAWTAQS